MDKEAYHLFPPQINSLAYRIEFSSYLQSFTILYKED